MTQDFYTRLGEYFRKVAEVLRGEADAAKVFPNASDLGSSREHIYANFLRQHAPSKCNVFLGGFLFHEDGSESAQLDVIVTTDTAPRFDFHNPSGLGKSFSLVEGTLAVASIKSSVRKQDVFDALKNIATIPPMQSLGKRYPPNLKTINYSEWPLKVVFAYGSNVSPERIYNHVLEFYRENSHIPLERRPNIIHIAGRCAIVKMDVGYTSYNRYSKMERKQQPGAFELFTDTADLQAILFVLNELQTRATISTHILFNHGYIINRVQQIDI